jgi:hypothetical protein
MTAQRWLLIGFPLMLIVLGLGMADWMMVGARRQRQMHQKGIELEVRSALDRVDDLVQARVLDRQQAAQEAAREAQASVNKLAQQVATCVRDELNLELGKAAPADNVSTFLTEHLKQWLDDDVDGVVSKSVSAGPMAVVPRCKELLLKRLPAGAHVQLLNLDNEELFALGDAPAAPTSAVRRLRFEWQGKPVIWRVKAGIASPQKFTPGAPLDWQVFLAIDARLQAAVKQGVRLRVQASGETAFVMSAHADDLWQEGLAAGQWQAAAGAAEGYQDERISSVVKGASFQAQYAWQPQSTLAWVGTQVKARPALVLMPLVGFVFTVGLGSWLWRRRFDVGLDVAPELPVLETPNTETLQRRGSRDVLADAPVLLADFDEPEHGVRLQEVSAGAALKITPVADAETVGRLAAVRREESSLLRLRKLYENDIAQTLHLERQIRSEVLRELLARVSAPEQTESSRLQAEG